MSLKIKICGITNLSDARNIVRFRPDFLGFIMYKKSPRYVKPAYARDIIKNIHSFVRTVGVFVNESPDDIMRYVDICNFDFVQLHGDESSDDVDFLEKKGIKVIKAFRLKNRDSLSKMKNYNCEYILLDAFDRNQFGGTGKSINKSILIDLKESDILKNKKVFLSGGLYSENLREAVSVLKPYGVDASSRLEASPGIKDIIKVRAFIEEARSIIL